MAENSGSEKICFSHIQLQNYKFTYGFPKQWDTLSYHSFPNPHQLCYTRDIRHCPGRCRRHTSVPGRWWGTHRPGTADSWPRNMRDSPRHPRGLWSTRAPPSCLLLYTLCISSPCSWMGSDSYPGMVLSGILLQKPKIVHNGQEFTITYIDWHHLCSIKLLNEASEGKPSIKKNEICLNLLVLFRVKSKTWWWESRIIKATKLLHIRFMFDEMIEGFMMVT